MSRILCEVHPSQPKFVHSCGMYSSYIYYSISIRIDQKKSYGINSLTVANSNMLYECTDVPHNMVIIYQKLQKIGYVQDGTERNGTARYCTVQYRIVSCNGRIKLASHVIYQRISKIIRKITMRRRG